MSEKNKIILKKLEGTIGNIIMWIELSLAIFILITIILSCKDIVSLIYEIFTTEALDSYEILHKNNIINEVINP